MWINENLPLEEIRFYQIAEKCDGGKIGGEGGGREKSLTGIITEMRAQPIGITM